MTYSRRTPPICHDRHERDLTALLAQYGGACWPLDDDLNTVAKTGVVRELSGAYPGAVSGTTYYNQVTVTGTLSPDATGTYMAAGEYGGYPFYYSQDTGFYVWARVAASQWAMSATLGVVGLPGWWARAFVNGLVGTYTAIAPATGTATLTAVTGSGIYRFDPAGVTFSQPGPVLGGKLQGAAGFDGAAGKVSIPFGNALDGKLLTVMGWVYWRSTSGSFPRFSDRVNFVCYFRFDTRHLGLLMSGTSSSVDDSATCTIPVTLNAWTHVAWVFGGSFYGAYVNGQTSGLKSANLGALTTSTAPIVLAGRTADNTRQLNGDLAYAAIIPAALTSNDIYALYHGALGG